MTVNTTNSNSTPSTSSGQNWLQRHERLIIVLCVLAVSAYCFNKYLDISIKNSDSKVQAATSAVTQAQADANAEKKETQAEVQKYQDLVQQLENQNKVLLSTIQNDRILLESQQKKDQDMSLVQLATRWNQLIDSAGVQAELDSMTISSEAAHTTVSQLESVPVLQEEVTKGSQLLENKENELSEANKVNLDLTNQNKSDILLLASKDKQCAAEKSAISANAARSKRNWFLRGLASGAAIVGYIALHFA